MAIEVELKAWVDDPGALERLLREQFSFEGTFRKEDVYFRSSPGSGAPREFRLRAEDGKSVVTWKEKSMQDDMEVNDEREFGVSDGQLFRELMLRAGCTIVRRKVKEGSRFSSGGITLELVRVEGLGTFIEIEKLVEDRGAVPGAASEIRDLLAQLGVGAEKIETRYYAELLARRGAEPGGLNRGREPGA